jgi:hypothetical protein
MEGKETGIITSVKINLQSQQFKEWKYPLIFGYLCIKF